MATYLLLNIAFMVVVFVVLRLTLVRPFRVWWIMFMVLLLLTAVFDNILIYFDIVAYAHDRLLGIYVGIAPVEDFFYAILAAFLVPVVWNKLGKSYAAKS